MSWVKARLETNGNGEISEISVLVEGKGWRYGMTGNLVRIGYGDSITLEMDRETFEDFKVMLRELIRDLERFKDTVELGQELYKLLKEFCEWADKDLREYVTQAVIERLKSDCEEIASYGIPKAEEFLKRIEELSS